MGKDKNYSLGYGDARLQAMLSRTVEVDAAYLLPYLRPEMKMLDCGCGPGSLTVGFAKILYKGTVVGCDLGDEQFFLARNLAKDLTNISFQKEDVLNLTFADNSFDVVHAHMLLCHVKDAKQALKEFKRVVKPGGIIAIRDTAGIDKAFSYPEHDLWRKFMGIWKLAMEKYGTDPSVGAKLREMFLDIGVNKFITTANSELFVKNGKLEPGCKCMIEDCKQGFGKWLLEEHLVKKEELDEFIKILENLMNDEKAIILMPCIEMVGFVS